MVSALLGFLVGLAASMVFVLFSEAIRDLLPGEEIGPPSSGLAPLAILWSLVWAPVYGALGALFTACSVSLYNLMARWTGGITGHLKDIPSPVAEPFSVDGSSDA